MRALNNEIGEDYRTSVLYSHSRLYTCTTVFSGFDHNRRKTHPRHRGVTHREVVFLGWRIGHKLRD
ncbi:hypothetical protein L828_3010 [Mycobacteroides abscessus MAB_030201_1061]|nr:hypothetical protein L828_3010 [Mycobacteroides abscessus MAB_030201_1061]